MPLKESIVLTIVLSLVTLGTGGIYAETVEQSADELAAMEASQASEAAAGSSTYADFNNDGFDDLAISAGLEDIGTIINAGAVHVLYGSNSGLQTSAPADQFWTQDSPGVEDTAEGGDQFGRRL